jgi:glutamate-1-semialdehyde aminotransferase
LEREIGRVQAEVQAARAAGNQAEVNAGIARLGQLDQVAAQERDIASGRRQLEEQLGQQREQYLQQLEQQQKAAQQEQQKFLEEQRKAVEAEQQRQTARIRELNTLGAGVIGGTDIRTAEGAALFLNLAANRQDPALIEARLQTRALQDLRRSVTSLVEGLTGLPTVRIPGAIG